MKKNMFLVLIISLTLLLSACGGGISAEEYADVVSENTSLKAEIESLSAENQSLSDKNMELLDQNTEQFMEQHSDIATTAWINTSFGDDSLCLSDSNHQYLQCIAGNTYSISDEGISDLWDDLLLSLTTLAYIKDSIPYQIISIRFLDPSGEYILDITLNVDEDTNMMHAIMCNALKSDIILPALQKLSD